MLEEGDTVGGLLALDRLHGRHHGHRLPARCAGELSSRVSPEGNSAGGAILSLLTASSVRLRLWAQPPARCERVRGRFVPTSTSRARLQRRARAPAFHVPDAAQEDVHLDLAGEVGRHR
jgi:hypothetical protein